MGHLRIALAFAILTITPFCVRTYMAITMAIFQKCLAPFHHKLAQHNFWKFIFNFDALASHVNLLQIHVSTYAKNDC